MFYKFNVYILLKNVKQIKKINQNVYCLSLNELQQVLFNYESYSKEKIIHNEDINKNRLKYTGNIQYEIYKSKFILFLIICIAFIVFS